MVSIVSQAGHLRASTIMTPPAAGGTRADEHDARGSLGEKMVTPVAVAPLRCCAINRSARSRCTQGAGASASRRHARVAGAIGVVRGTLWAPSCIHGWARARYGQCGKRARPCSKGTALWRRGRQEHALARSVSSRVERPRRPSRSPGRADHLLHLALLDHIIKALPRAQKHLSVKPWTTRPQAQIPSGKPSRDYEMRATVSSNFRSVCARSSSGAASHGNFPEN